jgi:F-type H+-transporting ATPase subunit a
MFILFANLSGMIPYAFTVTSHIIVTFAFAALVFVLVTLTGFMKNGVNFFKIFLPAGVPWWLAWLIIPIELISFLIRPMSLSVRLFANMMAGHIMLKVLAGFIIPLAAYYLIPALLPLLAVIALTGLEIIIAFLQAYVFAMLTCIYLTDAYHVEH